VPSELPNMVASCAAFPSGKLFYYGLYFNMFGLFLIFFQWNFFFRWKLRDKRKRMIVILFLDFLVQPRERFLLSFGAPAQQLPSYLVVA